jgi:hypothetical protein
MTDPSASDLLRQTLEALCTDLAAMRGDVGTLRAEAAARHVALNRQFDGLSEILLNINSRVATMEPQRQGSAVPAAVTGVADLARSAIMGWRPRLPPASAGPSWCRNPQSPSLTHSHASVRIIFG